MGIEWQQGKVHLVNEVKERGHHGVAAYVDNILVYTPTYDEHLATLADLFEVMEREKLTLRADKSEFAKQSLEFLGFVIDGKVIRPDPNNVNKLKSFNRPKTRKQLRSFLGCANFNRHFVKDYAIIAAPLDKMTSNNVQFKWEQCHEDAFVKLKEKISEASSLILPDFSVPSYLHQHHHLNSSP